jgi:FMN phosphatase YigB (HAD superfamily)
MGISMEQSIRWREESIEPALFLGKDPKLRRALELLSDSFALALVTNNPVLVASTTLRVLGVEDFFTILVGLDTCGVSKPHKAPFLKAGELLNLTPERCVSVGDRYDVDIAPSLELGMGGIMVEGVEDVYSKVWFNTPRLAAAQITQRFLNFGIKPDGIIGPAVRNFLSNEPPFRIRHRSRYRQTSLLRACPAEAHSQWG